MRALASGTVSAIVLFAFVVCCVAARQNSFAERIRIVPNEGERRVDVVIDGQPFTSYIWPERLAKPVLYPLRSARGTIVTRGFPLEPRAGERVDHPHHAGLWFNYGNVNGIDFWNNSGAIKPEDAPKMGNIRHRAITLAKSGPDQAELEIEADWITGKRQLILKEHTRFVFRGGPNFRSIDRITTLQALGEKVVFDDDKEGVLGMRVARALEAPSDKPEVFIDASGHATAVAKLDNTGVNGVYLTSEGKKAMPLGARAAAGAISAADSTMSRSQLPSSTIPRIRASPLTGTPAAMVSSLRIPSAKRSSATANKN